MHPWRALPRSTMKRQLKLDELPPCVSKKDLYALFKNSRVWLRKNVFNDRNIKQMGIDPERWRNAKIFNLEESQSIKTYLAIYQ